MNKIIKRLIMFKIMLSIILLPACKQDNFHDFITILKQKQNERSISKFQRKNVAIPKPSKTKSIQGLPKK